MPNLHTFCQLNPYLILEEWLDEAILQLEDKCILLNIDEFEKLGEAIKQGQIPLNILDEIRHLIQHYQKLIFLFSGVKNLEELGPNWSSYFINVIPIQILYLEPEEAQELLVNPDPDFALEYDEGIVEKMGIELCF